MIYLAFFLKKGLRGITPLYRMRSALNDSAGLAQLVEQLTCNQ